MSRAKGTLALLVALMLCFRVPVQGNNNTSFPFILGPGFTLPDSLYEFSLTYYTVDNLIVLPFVINGDVRVNLILDTGCQTLILFGKQYEKMFNLVPGFNVTFSGIGAGKPATGTVALGNTVTLGPVKGDNVPIVIVSGKKLFRHRLQVDGLIGYDLFTRFEIEIHPIRQEITFRSAFGRSLPPDYHHIPLDMEQHRPIVAASFALPEREESLDMLVDTGSSLSILLTTSDRKRIPSKVDRKVLGMGINGFILGSNSVAGNLQLNDYTAYNVPVDITYSPWHDYASMGMAFLRNYSVIINCVEGYIGLRPPEEQVMPEEIL